MPASPTARRNALSALFFLPGITISSWVTRTPDVRDLVGASTAQMGLILFGLSVGSMTGILAAGPLVSRWGTRPVMIAGTLAMAFGAAVIGTGAHLGSGLVVAIGLGLFGFGMGGGEVSFNIEGAEIERELGRSTMPLMHGFFSLGTVVGATAGMVLTALAFPVSLHLWTAAAIAVAALAVAIRPVPAGVGKRTAADTAVDAPRAAVWKDSRLLLIGGVILALAMAEGTANDWLPLVMVDGYGMDAALGSGIFAAFAAAMTIGRFLGGRLVDRFGRAAVLCACALVSGVGMALVVFADNQIVAGAAAILWGLGASLGFPVAISAAGDSGPNTAARVSLAATIGYVAFLVGPPALGFLGEHYGLRTALIAVLVLVLASAFITPAARRPAARIEGAPEEPAEAR
ncbi:Fucose permease [Glycomyces sambucus]|uniref:Fucose permease n=1 Tax=Glycomyces sambucus TaxID=380244 RepID=A0A1G9EYW3_9ACTN|nr:MFS transporter [Glycomyces sambucus]SDK81354.1 Fucose permease [Glycomyces sambucus]